MVDWIVFSTAFNLGRTMFLYYSFLLSRFLKKSTWISLVCPCLPIACSLNLSSPEVDLRERFEYRQFVWKVIPGNTCRKVRK